VKNLPNQLNKFGGDIMRLILSLLMIIGLTFGLIGQNSQVNDETSVGSDGANRITLAGAKKHFDDGDAVFIDTRSESAYQQEHIKGSINVTMQNLEEKLKDLPKNKRIIAYCSWREEHTSAGLVLKLKEKGITNAYALIGGTQAWVNAKYPTEGEAKK
jgi:rhodanese-related sulfurtransferase